MEKIKCAHIFLIPEGNPKKHYVVIETSKVKLEIYAVGSYEAGESLCNKLVIDGVAMIELCGSWGYEGAARITKAVDKKVPVAVITHQQHNAGLLAEVMKKSENPYNKL